MVDGLHQSIIIFYIPCLVWLFGPATSWNGKVINSLADFGRTVAVAIIFTANAFV